VSVFNKNTRRVLSYDILRQQKTVTMTRGVELPSSPAYNVEPVTNTSSSSCANNGRRTPRRVLDACRRLSQLCLSYFATRTVDNTVDLHVAKPNIRPESRFCLLHLHSTPPLWGFPSEYWHPVWSGKTIMVWLPDSEKFLMICLFVLTQLTNVPDRQTDTHTPHNGIGRAYASHRKAIKPF